jgi:hypothetical protein
MVQERSLFQRSGALFFLDATAMPVLYYLYSSVALTLSYWTHRPFHVLTVLLLAHLFYTNLYDASNHNRDELFMWKPLTLLFGCAVGGGTAYVLRAPRVLSSWQPWWYWGAMLALGLLQLGSYLCWQLAPLAWWNQVFLGWTLQLAVLVISFWALPHDAFWYAKPGTSLRVHYHYFMLSMLVTNVPYLVGSLTDPAFWQFWYAVISAAVGLYWLLVHHFTAYDRPAERIAYVATERPLDQSVWEDRYM